MAKLTVKNVGPIREAELEVKKHTVFIGPQGTGKSTLAKLIAIGSDYDVLSFTPAETQIEIFNKYNIETYVSDNSFFLFEDNNYSILLNKNKKNDIIFHKEINEDFVEGYMNNEVHAIENKLKEFLNTLDSQSIKSKEITGLIASLQNIKSKASDSALKHIIGFNSAYIPAERFLISMLSEAIWSFAYAKINLPQAFNSFARIYEAARGEVKSMFIPFLGLHYKNQNKVDKVITSGRHYVNLSESASGYQSIIPLLLSIEHLRQENARRFIIEEPELNLYPTAQKDLIYALIGGLNPDVSYQDAEWVLTTHSPYVLSSFNTLILAYKVGNQSDELRVEVEKIIPSRCWINPDEFAAYYVDNGTVRSIINPQTGLIADNELDDVSEELADEQDKLLALRRSVTRA